MQISKTSYPSQFLTNPELYSDILFLVQLVSWTEVNCASGVIIEQLGISGDLKVESMAILREFCLDPTPHDPNEYRDIVHDMSKEHEILPKELEYRLDYRKECVFTIDPLTARDLDDAVSCKQLPNGNFYIGVHISDASFYLDENTTLDQKVKNKATTIYLVNNVYHMLPLEMCLHCSLLPGKDKLAFSVCWEMTPDGEVLNENITRSVINSCGQLAYEHAQAIIENPDLNDLPVEIHNGFQVTDLSRTVTSLHKLATILRQNRIDNGALKIDQIKIGFSLDPVTGKPTGFRVCEMKEANWLIEEFMLLANITVAKRLNEAFPDLAFLR